MTASERAAATLAAELRRASDPIGRVILERALRFCEAHAADFEPRCERSREPIGPVGIERGLTPERD